MDLLVLLCKLGEVEVMGCRLEGNLGSKSMLI